MVCHNMFHVALLARDPQGTCWSLRDRARPLGSSRLEPSLWLSCHLIGLAAWPWTRTLPLASAWGGSRQGLTICGLLYPFQPTMCHFWLAQAACSVPAWPFPVPDGTGTRGQIPTPKQIGCGENLIFPEKIITQILLTSDQMPFLCVILWLQEACPTCTKAEKGPS